MKNRLLAALVCAFIALSCVAVFADTDGDLSGAVDIIIGEHTDNTDEVPDDTTSREIEDTTASPPETTKPPEPTKPPETTKTPEPTKPPETTEVDTTANEPIDTDPQTQESTGGANNPVGTQNKTTDPDTDETSGRRPNTSQDDTSGTDSRDTESKNESTAPNGENNDKQKTSRFSSPAHVIAFILGIPAIISFYALAAIVARRIVYGKADENGGADMDGKTADNVMTDKDGGND